MRTNSWGRFQIFHFFIVGWTLQAVHTLDKSEKVFRIICEAVLLLLVCMVYGLHNEQKISGRGYIAIFAIVHTFFLMVNSAGLVWLRECFKFIKNPGIHKVLDFLLLSKRFIISSDYAESMLVYGSISRNLFHGRSDLDVRVVRRKGLWRTFKLMLIAIILRVIAGWRYHIPLDLKIVDSMEYLKSEMRFDEKPIVVYCRPGFDIYNRGIDLDEIRKNPSMVLKPTC